MTAISLPTRGRHQNLSWTTEGEMLGTYFVRPLDYGLKPKDDKEIVGRAHESLSLSVNKYALLLGTHAPLDLVDMMHRSLDQVDQRRHGDHIKEALASFDRMRQIRPTTRICTVSIPLGAVGDHFTPTDEDLHKWLSESSEQSLMHDPDEEFNLTPVPEALLPFLWNHGLMRGTAFEVMPADPTHASPAAESVRAKFRTGIIDEAARNERSWFNSFDSITKTMVELEDGHVISSYQSMLTPTAFPVGGMRFPDHSEFLSVLDSFSDMSVDWAMRIRRTDRETAQALNEKALENLRVQIDQRSVSIGFHNRELYKKLKTLEQFSADLADNENAEEIDFTTVLAVGAPSTKELKRNVKKLTKKFRQQGIKLSAPRGCQNRLWHMFNPGAPNDQVYSDYEHLMTSDQFGGLAPFTTARFLDETGPVIGVNLLSGHFDPLHFNFIGKALNDSSPAIAVGGEPGSGKTFFTKFCASITHDLSGQFMAIDRSPKGEYLPLVKAIPGTVPIDLTDPRYTLDALQLFTDPDTARHIFLSTILPMLAVQRKDRKWQTISYLLRKDIRFSPDVNIRTSADLRDYLSKVAAGTRTIPGDFPDDRRIAHKIEAYELIDAIDAVEAPVIFGREFNGRPLSRPPLDAAGTIIRTHGLALPTAEELRNEATRANLPWAKLLGHALYELVGHWARAQFVADTGRFGMLIVDEAYHFTASAVGTEIIEEFVRDGRKHLAGLILSSQDPKADYVGVAHSLIPNRFAFRHRNPESAANLMEWLGVDISDRRNRHLIKALQNDTSPVGARDIVPFNRRGEFFAVDSRNRIGRGKILGPALPDRFHAITSTPELRDAA